MQKFVSGRKVSMGMDVLNAVVCVFFPGDPTDARREVVSTQAATALNNHFNHATTSPVKNPPHLDGLQQLSALKMPSIQLWEACRRGCGGICSFCCSCARLE